MHSMVVRRLESRVSNRCLMDGDAYPLFPILPQSRSIVVPSRRFSLSLSARTQMFLASSSSSLFLRFPRYKSDPSDSLLRARELNPLCPRNPCVILDSVGMSDPLKGQRLILGRL